MQTLHCVALAWVLGIGALQCDGWSLQVTSGDLADMCLVHEQHAQHTVLCARGTLQQMQRQGPHRLRVLLQGLAAMHGHQPRATG